MTDDQRWRVSIMDSWIAGCKWGLTAGFLLGALVVWFAK